MLGYRLVVPRGRDACSIPQEMRLIDQYLFRRQVLLRLSVVFLLENL